MGNWNVSGVTTMNDMFYKASLFNQDISKWDVSRVTDMGYMFSYASSFNQDISKWDVSRVTDMEWMFGSASSFNQSLCSWLDYDNFPENVYTSAMFFKSGCSYNYNSWPHGPTDS